MTKRQEVNLYVPELRKQFDPLSPQIALAACAAVVGLMLMFGALGLWQSSRMTTELEALRQEKDQLDQTVVTLRKAAPKSQAQKLLKELDKLKERAEARRVIKRIIAGQDLGNARGFSGHLHGFSRQIGNDVAINRFELSLGGSHVELHGFTREAAAVPRLLELLQAENSFQEVTFGQLSIAQVDENVKGRSKELQFSLGSRDDDENSIIEGRKL